jgi:outer membrane protein assembly factor BamB
MKMRSLLLVGVGLPVLCLSALAADWPQFRGPDRTGVSKETGLLKTWPKNGPPLAWKYDKLGVGYSGPAIVGDRVYILGGLNETEYVIALDVKGGKVSEAWKTKVGPLFSYQNWGDGPRSTPTVDGKLLFALGGHGTLVCVETDKGKELWRKDLAKDLGGEMMSEWGYSESPLVDGDLVIVTPGGEKGTLAALKKATGEVVWRSKELTNKAPYSSVVVTDAGGVRQYVQTSYISDEKGGVVSGVRAKDGKLLWTHPFHEGDSYAIVPTPIVKDNLVYVTAGYGWGSRLIELKVAANGAVEAKELYTSKKQQRGLVNNHGGAVLVGDHVYGHSESRGWVCQELKTGKVAWDERNQLAVVKGGSVVAADGRIYLYTDEGNVGLIKATAEGWQEAGTFEIPEKSKLRQTLPTFQSSGVWTHPVIANGRLYLRDQELLFCFDIRAKK